MIVIRLSRLLGDYRMTQAELSRLTGIRPNTINEMYHGTLERINLEQIDRICEVLGCGLEDLLERRENVIRQTGRDLIVEEHGRRKG